MEKAATVSRKNLVSFSQPPLSQRRFPASSLGEAPVPMARRAHLDHVGDECPDCHAALPSVPAGQPVFCSGCGKWHFPGSSHEGPAASSSSSPQVWPFSLLEPERTFMTGCSRCAEKWRLPVSQFGVVMRCPSCENPVDTRRPLRARKKPCWSCDNMLTLRTSCFEGFIPCPNCFELNDATYDPTEPCKYPINSMNAVTVLCPEDGNAVTFSSRRDGSLAYCDDCHACFTLDRENACATYTRCSEFDSQTRKNLVALARTLHSTRCGSLMPRESFKVPLWPPRHLDGCGCPDGEGGDGFGAAAGCGGAGDPSLGGCPVWVCCKGNCDPYSGWTKYPSIYSLKSCPTHGTLAPIPPCPPDDCVTVEASSDSDAVAKARAKIMADGAPAGAIHGCGVTARQGNSYTVCCKIDWWCDPGPPQRGNLPAGMGCCCAGSCGTPPPPPRGGGMMQGAGAPPPPPPTKKPAKNRCCFDAEWGCGGYILTGTRSGDCPKCTSKKGDVDLGGKSADPSGGEDSDLKIPEGEEHLTEQEVFDDLVAFFQNVLRPELSIGDLGKSLVEAMLAPYRQIHDLAKAGAWDLEDARKKYIAAWKLAMLDVKTIRDKRRRPPYVKRIDEQYDQTLRRGFFTSFWSNGAVTHWCNQYPPKPGYGIGPPYWMTFEDASDPSAPIQRFNACPPTGGGRGGRGDGEEDGGKKDKGTLPDPKDLDCGYLNPLTGSQMCCLPECAPGHTVECEFKFNPGGWVFLCPALLQPGACVVDDVTLVANIKDKVRIPGLGEVDPFNKVTGFAFTLKGTVKGKDLDKCSWRQRIKIDEEFRDWKGKQLDDEWIVTAWPIWASKGVNTGSFVTDKNADWDSELNDMTADKTTAYMDVDKQTDVMSGKLYRGILDKAGADGKPPEWRLTKAEDAFDISAKPEDTPIAQSRKVGAETQALLHTLARAFQIEFAPTDKVEMGKEPPPGAVVFTKQWGYEWTNTGLRKAAGGEEFATDRGDATLHGKLKVNKDAGKLSVEGLEELNTK